MLALLATLLSAPAPACDSESCTHTPEQVRAWIREQFEAAAGRKVKYRVVGLDCAECPKRLRKRLLRADGVNAVLIEGEMVHIAYDTAKIEHAGLIAAIREAGFREYVMSKGPIPAVQPE